MELKEYQIRALNTFTRWLNALESAQAKSQNTIDTLEQTNSGIASEIRKEILNYPKAAWQTLSEAGEVAFPERPYVDRQATNGYPIPHICLKLPTGGGKTLLGAAALERVNRNSGLVLWMVPTSAIYEQTKSAIWNREHSYRQMLERSSGGRVKVLEKNDAFTVSDLNHYLCVMLISLQSANRRNNREFLKLFQDTGRYMSFFPDSDDIFGDARLREEYPDLAPEDTNYIVDQSLHNVFKMTRPIVILDEAHKAYGRLGNENEYFAQSINALNPSLVIELTATPSSTKSNLLVDVTGKELKDEEMIKLPIEVTAFNNTDWHQTLIQAQSRLEELDNKASSFYHSNGRYIRPIAVIRVERVGRDMRDGEHIHSEDVRDYLIQNLGIPSDRVAVQSSSDRELENVDLFSDTTQVRWIITQSALMEGWDCSFAYLLVLLDNTRAKRAVTQLIGRVLRQPDAQLTGIQSLDQCYVFCQSASVNDSVNYVKSGLEHEGMGDLQHEVHAQSATSLKPVIVNMKESFRDVDIFLPKVLHKDPNDDWVELDFERHLLPNINLDAIRGFNPSNVGLESPIAKKAIVDVKDTGIYGSQADSELLQVDDSVKISWYARRLSDLVPNAFQAARLAHEMIQSLRKSGEVDSRIYAKRSALAAWLREHVAKAIDEQSEQVFRSKLASREIRFDLEASNHNHRVHKSYEVVVGEEDVELQSYATPVQSNLFQTAYQQDFNDLERRFAFYLDEQKALDWWYRVGVRKPGEYYLRGWRRERIWPDFVTMAGQSKGRPSLLVFETKGDHLVGSDDTEYKKRVFAELEKAFNAGKMVIHQGQVRGAFRLVFDKEGFPEANEAFAALLGLLDK